MEKKNNKIVDINPVTQAPFTIGTSFVKNKYSANIAQISSDKFAIKFL